MPAAPSPPAVLPEARCTPARIAFPNPLSFSFLHNFAFVITLEKRVITFSGFFAEFLFLTQKTVSLGKSVVHGPGELKSEN